MKRVKKALSLLLAICMLMSMLPGLAMAEESGKTVPSYSDMDSHWAREAVERWSGYEILTGSGDGTFRPDTSITRGEMAKVIATALKYETVGENVFEDVDASAWYADSILKCYAAGVLAGDGAGHARPTAEITRQEASKMLAVALGVKPSEGAESSFTDSGDIAPWALPYVTALESAGYINGIGGGAFAPGAPITRASTVTILNNAVSEYITAPGTYKGDYKNIVIVTCGGVTFEKATIGGNLIVSEGTSKDGVVLKDTKVQGTVLAPKDAVKEEPGKNPSGGGDGGNEIPASTSSSIVIIRNGTAPALLSVGTSSVTVKTNTTVSTLLSQIKAKDGTNQSYRVTTSEGAAKVSADVVTNGDQLTVTSSNGDVNFTNTLHVKDALNPTKEYWDDVTYSQIDETVNANTPTFKDVDYVVTSEKYMALVHDMEETYNILDPENKNAIVSRTQTVQNYTPAIQTAIDDATAAGGGRVVLPAAKDATAENPTVYYAGSIELKSNVNLYIEENVVLKFVRNITNEYYPMVLSSYEGNDTYNYASPIRSFHAKNIALTGKGTLDPQADNYNWWPWKSGSYGQPAQATVVDILVKQWSDGAYPVKYRLLNDGTTPLPAQIPTMDIDWNDITKVTMINTPTADDAGKAITPIKSLLRPCTIETYASENILIEGIKIVNSPMWEVHPLRSRNILVRGLDINSHGPNNDGVDPESCRNVVIENCSFSTGDDCIAIKSGKNRDGYSRGQVGGEPSENILVRNSVFADGHGGVTAGSECTGGIRNVFATDNHYDSVNLQQVLRFKTNSYRGGLIENIYFKDSTVAKASNALMYGETQYTAGSAQDKEGDLGPYTPQLKNVYMSNIVAGAPDSPVNASNAIYYTAYERAPMTDIKVKDVVFYGVKNEFKLVNVKNFELDNVKISRNTATDTLTTYNTVPITMENVKLTVDGKDYPLSEDQKLTLPEDTDKANNATVSGTIATADAKFSAGTGTVKIYLDRGIVAPGKKAPTITPYNATVTKGSDGKYTFTVEIPLSDKPDYQYPYRPESEEENMALNNHIISIVATGEVHQQNTWNFNVTAPDITEEPDPGSEVNGTISLNWNTYAMACGKDNDNGETLTLTATYNKSAYSNPQVRWTTGDATIVAPQAETGDSVVVKSRTTGFVNITASLYDGEKLIGTDICRISSIDGYDRATMQSLDLSADKLTLSKSGGAVTLTPIFFPVDIPTNGKMDTSLEVVGGYDTGVISVTLNEDQDYANYADIGNLAKVGVKILYDQVVVTPVATGTTTFTVRSKVNGRTATCTVTVAEEALTVTDLTGGSADAIELTVDGEKNAQQLTVTPVGGTSDIIWTSSNPHIASVDRNGLVTARSTSNYEERVTNSSSLEANDANFKTVTITATSVQGGFAQTFKVMVKPHTIKATGLSLNQAKLNLAVGTPGYLYASVNPAAILSPEVEWTSSNESVVAVETVNDTVFGAAQTMLTPKAAGTATITAAYAGFSDTCTVTVTADVVKVSTVTLSGPDALVRDQVDLLTANVTENATNQKVFWLSSNRTVVTVDREGNVQGYDAGEATIYAFAMDSLSQEQKDILFFTPDLDKLADEQAAFDQLSELRNLSADEEGMQKLTNLLASGVVYGSRKITVEETEQSRYLRNLHVPEETVTNNSVALLWNRDSLYTAGELVGSEVRVNGALVAELENEMGYTVKGLVPSTSYTFEVTTYYGNGQSVNESLTVTTKAAATKVLDVTKAPYNAVGDGSTMDTYAIQRAIDDCPKGGEVYLPAGHIFYSGALFLKSDMTFRVDGILMGSADPKDYPRIVSRWEGWRKIYQPHDEWAADKGPGSESAHAGQDNEYVYSSLLTLGVYDEGEDGYTAPYNLKNVIICGEGQVNANGYRLSYNQGPNSAMYYGPNSDNTLLRQNVNLRGHTLLTHNVKDLYVTGVMLSNAPAWTLDLIYSRDLTLDDVSIVALSNYKTDVNGRNYILNGDGCDVDSSIHVNIVNSFFRAGDDAIAAKSGKNREGWMRGKPTAYLRVSDVFSLGSRYGLIIGSEMAGGAHDLLFQNNEFKDNVSDNSMWIKAPRERGGLVEDIVYRDIISSNTKAAIRVEADYSDSYKNTPSPINTRIRRLTYENLTDFSSAASSFKGKDNSIIYDVIIRGADFSKALSLSNIDGVTLIDVPAGYTPNATAKNVTVTSPAAEQDVEIKLATGAAEVKSVDLETHTVSVRKGTTVAQLKAQFLPVTAQPGNQTYTVANKEGDDTLVEGDILTVTAKNGKDTQPYTIAIFKADEILSSTAIEVIAGGKVASVEVDGISVKKDTTASEVKSGIRSTLGSDQTYALYADKAAAETAGEPLEDTAVLTNGNCLLVTAENGTDTELYLIKIEQKPITINLKDYTTGGPSGYGTAEGPLATAPAYFTEIKYQGTYYQVLVQNGADVAPGAYFEFAVDVNQKATYTGLLKGKFTSGRGTFKVSLVPTGGGAAIELGTANTAKSGDLGGVKATMEEGPYLLRFTYMGPSSGTGHFTVDSLTLTPVEDAPQA